MTSEDWKEVESVLSGLIGRVRIRADGRVVAFHRGNLGNRLIIGMTVDGRHIYPLSSDDPDYLYARPYKVYLYKPKKRAALKKCSKRVLKAHGINPDEQFTMYRVVWPNATAIRRHYQKHFEELKLIEAIRLI